VKIILALADDILTIVVAVISSLGAVTLSAVLAETFSQRRRKERSRSLVATCLESIYVQSPPIEYYFSALISPGEGLEWDEEWIPLVIELSVRTAPFKIPFDKVRENLLDLDSNLAEMILNLDIRVNVINRLIDQSTRTYSPVPTATMAQEEMVANLQLTKKTNISIAECVRLLSTYSGNARKQLFAGKTKIVIDWSTVDRKLREIDRYLMESIHTTPSN